MRFYEVYLWIIFVCLIKLELAVEIHVFRDVNGDLFWQESTQEEICSSYFGVSIQQNKCTCNNTGNPGIFFAPNSNRKPSFVYSKHGNYGNYVFFFRGIDLQFSFPFIIHRHCCNLKMKYN